MRRGGVRTRSKSIGVLRVIQGDTEQLVAEMYGQKTSKAS